MDTSEQYIKMCEKAEEIQNDWSVGCGDYTCIRHPQDRRVVIVTTGKIDLEKHPEFVVVVFPFSYGDNKALFPIKSLIWLPTQEELQGMVCDSVEDIMLMPTKFYYGEQDWYHVTSYARQFTSAEQLWLAYVYKEKYHKVWNGEDWVEERAS